MLFELNDTKEYSQAIVKLSILTSVAVLGCILFGFFCLPVAAAYYAALLLYERPGKRIMSIVIPAVYFALNFFLQPAFSLDALAYVVLGAIIYFSVKKSRSKGETAFWMTVATLVIIILTTFFLAFEVNGDIGFLSIKQFYSGVYRNLKEEVMERILALKTTSEEGIVSYAYNFYEAERLFEELAMSVIPLAILSAFLIVGISLKLFATVIAKYSGADCGIYFWSFGTSNLVAYFYVITYVIGMIAESDGSLFAFTVMSLTTVFSVVYAYIGVRFVFYFILSRGKSAWLAILIIALGFVIMSLVALQILSFIGVTVNIIANKAQSKAK